MDIIIEKVADAIDTAANEWSLGTDNEQHECPYEVLARAAIKATLEHLRDNVSEGMIDAVEHSLSRAGTIRPLPAARGVFSTMVNQALKELDRSEGLAGS